MSAHVAGTWWAIERYHPDWREDLTERWTLQWEQDPCWPRLFRTRAEARAWLAEREAKTAAKAWVDHAWLRKHWRLRPTKVRVVQI